MSPASPASDRGSQHSSWKDEHMTKYSRDFKERYEARIDRTATCWNWTGQIDEDGYARIWRGSRNLRVHRLAYEEANGPIPPDKLVDHACRNRRCVNPAHLRLATRKQNGENRSGAQTNNGSSGIRNVYWRNERSRWVVQVKSNGKLHHGGFFTELNDAAEAARQLRLSLFTHSDVDRIAI